MLFIISILMICCISIVIYQILKGICSRFIDGSKWVYFLLSFIPFLPLLYKHQKEYYLSLRAIPRVLSLGFLLVTSFLVLMMTLIDPATVRGNKSTTREDAENIKRFMNLIDLKYWDYVHQQPKENIIYAKYHYDNVFGNLENEYVVVLYKNTKPTNIPNLITASKDLKDDSYESHLIEESFEEKQLYKNDEGVFQAKQDSLILPCKKGLIENNLASTNENNNITINQELIIWDESTRLLYYKVKFEYMR